MAKISVPELRKLIALYKKDECPRSSRMTKKELLEFVDKHQLIQHHEKEMKLFADGMAPFAPKPKKAPSGRKLGAFALFKKENPGIPMKKLAVMYNAQKNAPVAVAPVAVEPVAQESTMFKRPPKRQPRAKRAVISPETRFEMDLEKELKKVEKAFPKQRAQKPTRRPRAKKAVAPVAVAPVVVAPMAEKPKRKPRAKKAVMDADAKFEMDLEKELQKVEKAFSRTLNRIPDAVKSVQQMRRVKRDDKKKD
jgi:hypothetical protein